MIGFPYWLDAAGSWVWHTSLHASVLIGLVWLIQRAFGKMLTPRWRYALGLLVLLRLVMPTVPPSPFSAFNLEQLLPPTPPVLVPSRTAMPQLAFVAPLAPVTVPQTGPEPKPPLDWGTIVQIGAKAAWLAGVVALLGIAGWRHRQLSRSVTQDAAVADPRVLGLLDEAKVMIGLTRSIAVVTTTAVATPAVFGFRKPRLLLSRGLCSRLDDGELRLIFLHELTHVRRGDVLLNWIAIFVRALHWFNPLVWLALRRLRADQELVCDASVLARLAPNEQRLYGHTLVKLARDFSETRLYPALAPVITHKHEIKRRVLMIAQFKPTGRIAVVASAMLLAAVCGLTFTRAAEPEVIATNSPPKSMSPGLRGLILGLRQLRARVAERQLELDDLRVRLQVPPAVVDGQPVSSLNAESRRHLDAERIAAQAQLAKYENLLAKLRSMSREELRKSLATAYPGETELVNLIIQRNTAQQEVARMLTDNTDTNPDVRRVSAVLKEINRQIDEKIDGILIGLSAVVESTRAQVGTLSKNLNEATERDADLDAKYRPYYEAKHRLDYEKRMCEVTVSKIIEECVKLAGSPGF